MLDEFIESIGYILCIPVAILFAIGAWSIMKDFFKNLSHIGENTITTFKDNIFGLYLILVVYGINETKYDSYFVKIGLGFGCIVLFFIGFAIYQKYKGNK